MSLTGNGQNKGRGFSRDRMGGLCQTHFMSNFFPLASFDEMS